MEATPHRMAMTAAIVVGVPIGAGAAFPMNDVILGVAIGAGFIAIATRIIKEGGNDRASPSRELG